MKIIDFHCKNCGNQLSAPEGTKRVLCGQCTTWNVPGRKSIRQALAEVEEQFYNSENTTIEDTPNNTGQAEKKTRESEDADEKDEKKKNPFSFFYLVIIVISSLVIYIRDNYQKEIEKILDDSRAIAVLAPIVSLVILFTVFIFIKKSLAERERKSKKS